MSIKDLVSHPRIWRGRDRNSASTPTVSTGFANLDQYLPGGGWPLRAITEIFLDRYGIGELSLLMPALSYLCRHPAKQWIVWVAPPFVPYAPALKRHGIDLSRILLVHSTDSGRDALWAAEQAIRSDSSAVTLAWVRDADVTALRRMQLSAEEHKCWAVLFRPMAALEQHSPAALRLKLSQTSPSTPVDVANRSTRGHAQLDVLKCRGGCPGTISIDNAALRGLETSRDRF